MAASSVAEAFDRTPFAHGFVFWEYPGPEHLPPEGKTRNGNLRTLRCQHAAPGAKRLPPADEAGQREWLEGFQQAHADYPDEPYDPDCPEGVETVADALRRMLPGHPYLPTLLAFL